MACVDCRQNTTDSLLWWHVDRITLYSFRGVASCSPGDCHQVESWVMKRLPLISMCLARYTGDLLLHLLLFKPLGMLHLHCCSHCQTFDSQPMSRTLALWLDRSIAGSRAILSCSAERGWCAGGIPAAHPHRVNQRWRQPHSSHLRGRRAVVLRARPARAAGPWDL